MSEAPAHPAPRPAAQRPPASSPEALDQITETTTPHGWWALWAIAGAVLVALIWSFVATIPQQVSATGVVSNFNYSAALTAPASGVLRWTQESHADLTPDTTVATVTPYDGKPPVDVKAGFTGSLDSIYVMDGIGVEAGTTLGSINSTPDPAKGIALVTYVSEGDALTYEVGATAQVTMTEIDTGKTFVTQAVIKEVADGAANEDGMKTASGSPSLAQLWMTETDGLPHRVVLAITDWPSDDKAGIPGPGQLADIVNTYGTIHPIQLLFGGN